MTHGHASKMRSCVKIQRDGPAQSLGAIPNLSLYTVQQNREMTHGHVSKMRSCVKIQRDGPAQSLGAIPNLSLYTVQQNREMTHGHASKMRSCVKIQRDEPAQSLGAIPNLSLYTVQQNREMTHGHASKMRSCVKIQRDDSWSCEQHEVMCVCCLDLCIVLCIVRLEIEGGSLGLPVRVPGICISLSVETRFLRGYRSLVWIPNSNTNFQSLSNRS